MNAQRRKKRDEAIEKLNEALAIIEEIKDEEDTAYENMPEGLQKSERGEHLQENVDALESIYDEIETQVSELEEVD